MLKMLLGPVADLASGYLQNKAEEKKLRHQAKMADASASSWKDEFWTLVLAAPVFMIGYAIAMDDVAVIERVDLAFAALNTLPEWYQYLLFLAVSASFGIRGADKLMNLRKK